MIALALACAVDLKGTVSAAPDAGGKPLVGASLHADGCHAVTDALGAFRTRCPRGKYSFMVTHPDYLDRAVDVDASGVTVQPVVTTLAGYPAAPGLYIVSGTAFAALARAPLLHTVVTGAAPEEKWCAAPEAATVEPGSAGGATSAAPPDAATVVPAGAIRLLEVHDREWRVYRLDAEGCAYRMTPGEASFWKFSADRVEEGQRTPISPGKEWVRLDLPEGEYAIVEWYDGFFVPEADGAAGWRVRAG